MKKPPHEWKNIFANDISSERLMFKIYKDLTQLNNKNKPGKKNGQRRGMDILPKKKYRWPTVTCKDAQHH